MKPRQFPTYLKHKLNMGDVEDSSEGSTSAARTPSVPQISSTPSGSLLISNRMSNGLSEQGSGIKFKLHYKGTNVPALIRAASKFSGRPQIVICKTKHDKEALLVPNPTYYNGAIEARQWCHVIGATDDQLETEIVLFQINSNTGSSKKLEMTDLRYYCRSSNEITGVAHCFAQLGHAHTQMAGSYSGTERSGLDYFCGSTKLSFITSPINGTTAGQGGSLKKELLAAAQYWDIGFVCFKTSIVHSHIERSLILFLFLNQLTTLRRSSNNMNCFNCGREYIGTLGSRPVTLCAIHPQCESCVVSLPHGRLKCALCDTSSMDNVTMEHILNAPFIQLLSLRQPSQVMFQLTQHTHTLGRYM